MRYSTNALQVTALLMTTLLAPPLEAQAGAPSGPGYHLTKVPTSAGAGVVRETRVLLETPHVKLATVILRQGAVLEEHSAATPVTIQVVSGRGTIELSGEKVIVGPGDILVLSPNKKHLVRPDEGSEMVLLIHHLKTPGPRQRRPGDAR